MEHGFQEVHTPYDGYIKVFRSIIALLVFDLCVLNGQQTQDNEIKHKTFKIFCSINDIDRSHDKPYKIF